MDVLSLLRSKNRCLLNFLDASKAFLAEAQAHGTLPSLPEFELQRESILKAIALFDRKITEAIPHISANDRTPELSQSVKEALEKKDQLIAEIMCVDQQVLNLVEEEKNRVARELANTQKSRNLVQKFKSTWVAEGGEEIDQSL
jgi:hypothetical protein